MKKLLWILGTIAAGVIWFFVAGFIGLGASIVIRIATGADNENTIAAGASGVIIIGWVGLVIASIVLYRRWKMKCHACKRWNALKRISTDVIKQENISVLMELEHRDLSRQVTGTHDQYIPGKRSTYKDTYKCKHCGNLETNIYTEKSASI